MIKIYNGRPNGLPIAIVLIVLFGLLHIATSGWAQTAHKKDLTAADYHLWGILGLDKTSANGQWVSYKMRYEQGMDTLFVRNSNTGETFSFPSARSSLFTTNDFFICQLKKDLVILNLKTGKQELIKSIKKYVYSPLTDRLVILTSSEDMMIRYAKQGTIIQVNQVVDFSLSPDEQMLAYTRVLNSTYSLHLFNLAQPDQKEKLVINGEENYTDFTWQKDGKSLAFLTKSIDQGKIALLYYILSSGSLSRLSTKELLSKLPNSFFVQSAYLNLMVSDDLKKVFFKFVHTEESDLASKSTTDVEIWNGNDKWVYERQRVNGPESKKYRTAVWFPSNGQVAAITSKAFPKMFLSGDQEYAIISDPKAYEPQFKEYGPMDYYVLNLKTSEKKLMLANIPMVASDLLPSPSGKYITYFKDAHWWIYNLETGKHNNLTSETKVSFSGKIYQLDHENWPFGTLGWTVNENELLIYDQYDIWAVKPDGSGFRRLTHGREKQLEFRQASLNYNDHLARNFDGYKARIVDLDKGLMINGTADDFQTGYFKWTKQGGEQQVVFGERHIDQMRYDEKSQSYIYTEERFDLSPRVMVKHGVSNPKIVFQSNPQQEKYKWGKVETILYKNSKGKKLKATLYYPAGYNPNVKYPMIVHVYQRQSNGKHRYVNPSKVNVAGYNRTVFTTQGYFVLLPDIELEPGIPGESAVDCTVSATNKIISLGLVNPKKIGLIGHSFGGYETAFIATQTDIFAAAVPGAAITDINSLYLGLNWAIGKPEMWRFEGGNWNLGATPFDNPSVYLRNSPMAHVNKVNTPLLIWSGKLDYQVHWHQSVSFYLALRRLHKKNIMLLYPEEGHSLQQQKNQMDLSNRVDQWFGYYLKDEKPADWIVNGTK